MQNAARLSHKETVQAPIRVPGELSKLRYVRERELLMTLPFGKTKLWELVREKKFPRPVKLTDRVTAWKEHEVMDWLRSKEVEGSF
jgi:predicted DNA-binding transcriptional regulator AlpA